MIHIHVDGDRMRAKPTRQHRAQETRDQILEAMEALLKRKPFGEIGVAELARKADVAPATIYQRFSNTDATASVLMELYFSKVEQWARRPRKGAGPAEAPLFDALVSIAGDGYDQAVELGYVMRPAYLYSRLRPDRVGADWARLEQVALEGFRGFLVERSAEIRVSDPARAAALLCYFFNFMLLGVLLHPEAPKSKPLRTRKEFADALATMAWRYLVHEE
jgi:AcrR family transcriptional regulator